MLFPGSMSDLLAVCAAGTVFPAGCGVPVYEGRVGKKATGKRE
jgi:hypothetical protein